MFNKKLFLLVIINLCSLVFFVFSIRAQPPILIIENGYGLPGQIDIPVSVSLENSFGGVRAVQFDICDVDDYLECTGCETTVRTSGFTCTFSELANGCARVILFDLGGDLIEAGSGSVLILNYDVAPSSPLAECRTLYIENLQVADENGNPIINPAAIQGKFFGCSDSCECEGNFDGDEDQDGSDAFDFKVDFGRSFIGNPCETVDPCNGDFDCDNDVDGSDAFTFKEDFGRSSFGNPCPYCPTDDPWCIYP